MFSLVFPKHNYNYIHYHFLRCLKPFNYHLWKLKKKLNFFDDNFRTRPFHRLVQMGAPFHHKHALVCKNFCAFISFYFCTIHPFFYKFFGSPFLQTSFFAPLQCPFLTLRLFHNTFIFIFFLLFLWFFLFSSFTTNTQALQKPLQRARETHFSSNTCNNCVQNFHSKKQMGQR